MQKSWFCSKSVSNIFYLKFPTPPHDPIAGGIGQGMLLGNPSTIT